MSLDTNNYYGEINISNSAIAVVAGFSALDCYGVVDLVSYNFFNHIKYLFKKIPFGRGVKVTTKNNRIIIDVFCVFKYGVSMSAVAESLKKSIKYSVENFSGMIVDCVNVHISAVQV